MPHISKRKLSKKVIQDLERHIGSVIRNSGSKTHLRIFDELLTQTEKIMLAKRIGILFLLKKGFSPYKISKLLGVNSSTVERFKKGIQISKYRSTVEWIWKNSGEGVFESFLESLVALAFTGRTKSFKKFIDEY